MALQAQEKRDYYEVLGVARDADADTIRDAYVMLSRSFHPDSSGDAESQRRFHEVAQAYDVLSNPESKLLYDRLAYRGPGNGGFGPPHPGVGKPTADSTHVSDDELLDRIFAGRPVGRPRALVGELKIGSVEARRGTRRSIAFEAFARCPECEGRGTRTLATRACPDCAGTGRQRIKSADGAKLLFRLEVCARCGGSARVPNDEACAHCDGAGLTISKRRRRLYVPPGVRDGQELVVDRVTAPDGVDRNAVVVLRVAKPRRVHGTVQLAAALLFVAVLALVVVLLLPR